MATDDKQARLAALRAKQEAREAAAKEAEEDAELSALEDLEAFEAKNGPVKQSTQRYLRLGGKVVVVETPDARLYRQFADSKATGIEEVRRLVRSCVVWPSKEAFDGLCEQLPAAPAALLPEVANLAGIAREALGKG